MQLWAAVGCLEAVSSEGAVLAYVEEAIAQGEKSSLSGTRPSNRTIEVVRVRGRRRRRDGDGRSATRRPHAWVRDRRVGEPAEPKASYPFWPRALAGPLGWEAAFASLREHCFAGTDRNMDFFVGSVDDVAWARGAACVVLSQLFSSPAHRSIELAQFRPKRAVLLST